MSGGLVSSPKKDERSESSKLGFRPNLHSEQRGQQVSVQM